METLNDAKYSQKFSYWKCEGSEPLKNLTVGNLLKESVSKYADGIAVSSRFQNQKLTYKQLYEQVESFAAGLIALGLRKGDHVGLWAPNCTEWIISFLAVVKAGFVAVNLNAFCACPELREAAEKYDVKAMIIGDALNERNYYEMIRSVVPELSKLEKDEPLKSDTLTHLRMVISMSDVEHNGTIRWRDVLSMATNSHKERLRQIEEEIDVHDVCIILLTSGTTGRNKGACHTHYSFVNNSYFVAKRMTLFDKPHVFCLQLPLFHFFGVVGMLCSVQSGTKVVLSAEKFSPTKSIEALIEEKCTLIFGAPTMYTDIINVATKITETDPTIFEKMSSLEIALVGASFCTPELSESIRNILGVGHVLSCYGMTEICGTFLSKITDTEDQITTTVGYALDHVEIKIVDDSGNVVPFGIPGEGCFKGYSVVKCYFNDKENTDRAMLPGGWFRSGDRLVLTKDGYGKIVGRIKETIIRGGQNIEPNEIERVLANHRDIVKVQVYGVYDARLGEVVVAAVIKRTDSPLNEEEVKKYCEGKIAQYKIPKYVEFVESYPLTTSGKVMKFRLRENFERKYNLK